MKISSRFLAWTIVIVATLFSVQLYSDLFTPGIPISWDLATHYGRLTCFNNQNIWSLTSAFCPWYNGGVVYFQGYQILGFEIALLLSKIFSLAFAYKLMLVLVYYCIPAGALFLLYKRGHVLAGAFAYVFLLFDKGGFHVGGYEQTFMIGMFENSLASGLFLFALAFAWDLFEKPSYKNLVFASISGALLFLAHIVPFSAYMVMLIVLAVYYRANLKSNWLLFSLLPIMVFLLTAFYSLPMIVRHLQGYYVSDLGAPYFSLDFFNNFFWNSTTHSVVILGIIGFILCFKTLPLISYGFLALVFLFVAPISSILATILTPIYITLIPIRLIAQIRELLFIFAGLFLERLFNSRVKFSLAPVIIVILLVFAYSEYSVTSGISKNFPTSENQDVKYMLEMYSKIPKDGRVLHEETLNRMGNSVLSGAHAESLAYAVGGLDSMVYSGFVMKEEYGNMGVEDLIKNLNASQDEFLRRLNIRYVVVAQPANKQAFGRFPILFEHGPWTVYFTNVSNSYFELSNGEVIKEEYLGTSAFIDVNSQGGKLLLKVHDYPNWDIRMDGTPTKTVNKPGYFIEVDVPSGKHSISFAYKIVLLDYLGYLLTIIGIILSIIFAKEIKMGAFLLRRQRDPIHPEN